MGWKRILTVSIYYHYCMKKKQAGGTFLDAGSSASAMEEV